MWKCEYEMENNEANKGNVGKLDRKRKMLVNSFEPGHDPLIVIRKTSYLFSTRN